MVWITALTAARAASLTEATLSAKVSRRTGNGDVWASETMYGSRNGAAPFSQRVEMAAQAASREEVFFLSLRA
jgi:hypothetical protein